MLKKLLLVISILLSLVPFSQDTVKSVADEFEEFTGDSLITTLSSPATTTAHKKSGTVDIYWTTGILLFTTLAGVLIRFKATRQLRSLFLVLSIVVLGFYRGGCPCSIQSLQHGFLLLTGVPIQWQSLLLFAGLLPVTYFFGRVYCGWICQLGALQEFIFKTSSIKLFQSERSQKVMRHIRVITLTVLIFQLLITRSNLYKQIDPFASIYNFYSAYAIGWVLVAVMIISSVVLYRPFCKTLCPVGLILGWVSKIPGASVLGVQHDCNSCALCNKECEINAITRNTKTSVLDNQECIRCGSCINACKKQAFRFYRRNRNHHVRCKCKPISLTTVCS